MLSSCSKPPPSADAYSYTYKRSNVTILLKPYASTPGHNRVETLPFLVSGSADSKMCRDNAFRKQDSNPYRTLSDPLIRYHLAKPT